MIDKPNPVHLVAYEEVKALLTRHGDNVSALEMLAIAANLTGKLIALQDQNKITPEVAMSIVAANIEEGNREAIAQTFGEVAGHG